MNMYRLLITLAVCAFAFPAFAGDNEWTPGSINGGGVTSITVDGTGVTEIIETRLCASAVIMTEDTIVTYDINFCRTDDPTTCRRANATTPLTSSTTFGAQFEVISAYVQLNILSVTGTPTFTLSCSK